MARMENTCEHLSCPYWYHIHLWPTGQNKLHSYTRLTGEGGFHKHVGLGEWGASQAIGTAAYYDSSIPGLFLMVQTNPVLGSCYSLTKSLSYFCSIPYLLEPEVFL